MKQGSLGESSFWELSRSPWFIEFIFPGERVLFMQRAQPRHHHITIGWAPKERDFSTSSSISKIPRYLAGYNTLLWVMQSSVHNPGSSKLDWQAPQSLHGRARINRITEQTRQAEQHPPSLATLCSTKQTNRQKPWSSLMSTEHSPYYMKGNINGYNN